MCDLIYYNGNIITVNDDNDLAEAVAIFDGKIIKVGNNEEVLSFKNADTKLVDLCGKTMLPGFIDGHSHLSTSSRMVTLPNLSPPPIGTVNNIDDIVDILKKYISDNKIPENEMIIGVGYDDSLLNEKRHINKFDLDRVSTKHKVYIIHASVHLGCCNSVLLEELGINENTPNPKSGVICRLAGTTEPSGIIEEQINLQLMIKSLPVPTEDNYKETLKNVQQYYASQGITTAQDGALSKEYYELFNRAALENLLFMDIVGYSNVHAPNEVDSTLEYIDEKYIKKYSNNFKIGGMKVFLDGSPQGKTAWLSEPYKITPEGKSQDYRGYPVYKNDEFLQNIYDRIVNNKLQVLTHTNGDEACEQLIRCYEKSIKRTDTTDDLRPVMIHAQTVREDQLDRMKKIGMMPSFFAMHTYFWGDWHIESVLGEKRGNRISPVASAVKRKIPFTLHCDAPVLPISNMYMLWTAVNRLSRTGRIIGKDQRISVMEAIKGLTKYAAYQYFEENNKGSIERGKKADLVVLDSNPLTIPIEELRYISILETVKDGKTIYKADKCTN